MTIDWTNADFAEGPLVAAWLREGRLPELGEKYGDIATLSRAITRWEHGERLSLEKVDKWLTRLGYHISELPDEVWRVGAHHGPHRDALGHKRRRKMAVA